MDHEQFDTALDAAAKELLTDAPDELLKGVMLRIENDAKPKRRFAFGRFTGFAAVAAALLIFFSYRIGADLKDGMWSENADMPAPEGAPSYAAPAEAPGDSLVYGEHDADSMYETAHDDDSENSEPVIRSDASGGSSEVFISEPPPSSLYERMLYEYLSSLDVEVISVDITEETEDRLTAVAVLESQTLDLTVTREGVSSSVAQDPQTTGQEP